MADPFIGEIALFAFDFAPEGWAFCDGRQLSVKEYSSLYALIGNKYGGDKFNFNLPDLRNRTPICQDHNTTPPIRIGNNGGAENNVSKGIAHSQTMLRRENLPEHTHNLNSAIHLDIDMAKSKVIASTDVTIGVSDIGGNTYNPIDSIISNDGGGLQLFSPPSIANGMMGGVVATTLLEGKLEATIPLIGKTENMTPIAENKQKPVEVESWFESKPFSVMQPYLVLNYCIYIAGNGVYPSKGR